MVDVPFDPKIDSKNSVVDGRDFALKCITHAYRLLGAYANGDRLTYERLKGITEYLAEQEISMQGEDVPNLMLVLSDDSSIAAEERWNNHVQDTEQKTQNLLDMSDRVSGRHRSLYSPG